MVIQTDTKKKVPSSLALKDEQVSKNLAASAINELPPLLAKARDIAQALSVSERQVTYWRAEGRIPGHVLGTRCVRYRLDEVLEALGIELEGGRHE